MGSLVRSLAAGVLTVGDIAGSLAATDALRQSDLRGVSFREFNLLRPFEGLGKFQIIFCRNVLIYFSAERKRDIIERMARALLPGGYLILGSTESMSGHQDLFDKVKHKGILL